MVFIEGHILVLLNILVSMMQKLPVEGAIPSLDVVEAGGNMDEIVTCEENSTGELQQVNEHFKL